MKRYSQYFSKRTWTGKYTKEGTRERDKLTENKELSNKITAKMVKYLKIMNVEVKTRKYI